MAPPTRHDVRLLGRPAMRARDGEWSDLKPGHTAALLGYLAFKGGWVERGELAALFWPDRSEEAARANLRPLLWRLAHEPWPVGLERERTRVRWPVRTDHQTFVEAWRAERWKDAWDLQGALLAGVSLPAAPAFDAWLELERATVWSAVRTAGLRVADAASRAGDDESAANVLGTLYRSDAFDEAVLRSLVSALARRGSGTEALALVARFERLCHDELDAEPEAATRELGLAIRAGRVEPSSTPSVAPERVGPAASRTSLPPLPTPLTPFVGRADVVAAVSRQIDDASCRILTLVGSGGVGKTRIAIEVARNVGHRFEAGARFVELVTVSTEGALLAAVAGATGVDLTACGDPKQRVLGALEALHMLLVLDNVEHLDEVPALVAELVTRAPGVTVLLTSRRATGLSAEWVMDVVGLAHLDDTTLRRERSRSIRSDDGRPTESAELFVLVARRAGAVLPPEAGPTIERLCAHLGGVPLAIELAAAWSRVLDVHQIEAELERGLDILSGAAPDRDPRHDSMRVVFEHSWAMLPPHERAAMRRLTPFRGGFSLHAASEAASIAVPVLLALTNTSFLRRSGDGRYSRHPLLWHFARERAEERPAELRASRDRHASYFLRFLAERRDAFHLADGERMMLEIAADLENVTAAWRWACDHEQRGLLRAAVTSLGRFCWLWGRYDLQDELFPRALEIAAGDDVLRGMLLVHQGAARTWRSIGDFGVSLFDEALSSLETEAGPVEMAWAVRGHAVAHKRLGHREIAAQSFARAGTLYRQIGDVEGVVMMDISCAPLADTASEALSRFDACVETVRAAPASHPSGMALAGRAEVLLVLGEFAAAEASVREAQRAQRGARAPTWSLDRRNLRALVCIDRGRLRSARALCCRTLSARGRSASEVASVGDAATVAMAALARIAYLTGADATAVQWARRALEHHRQRHGASASYDRALYTLVRISLTTGDLEAARRWSEEFGRGPDPRWYSGPLNAGASSVAVNAICAEVALALGDEASATVSLRSAMVRARREELLSAGLGALVVVAGILDRRGDRVGARRLIEFLRGHPRATFETQRATALLHDAYATGTTAERDTSHAGVLAALDRAIADL